MDRALSKPIESSHVERLMELPSSPNPMSPCVFKLRYAFGADTPEAGISRDEVVSFR
jgi:hypothetical protein